MPSHTHLRAYLWAIAILALVAIVAAILNATLFKTAPAPQQQTTLQSYPASLPPLAPQDSIGQQQGFQALVQYTASGFHPATVSIKKGDTVRFINTTAQTLTLSLSNATQKQTLSHGAYYEQDFTKIGTFSFSDGVTKGTVTVQ
jgi:plastocyanin